MILLAFVVWCSESGTPCTQQERKLNTFHIRCLQRIFDITWQDKVSNRVVLERAGIFSMYTLLKQQHLRWLGHVVRMVDGWIPKDLLLPYKDICKQDLKALGMDLNKWETLTSERSAWRQALHHSLSHFEETLVQQVESKRESQKQQNQGAGQGTDCTCFQCGRDGHSQIGLLSCTRCCSKSSIQSTLP